MTEAHRAALGSGSEVFSDGVFSIVSPTDSLVSTVCGWVQEEPIHFFWTAATLPYPLTPVAFASHVGDLANDSSAYGLVSTGHDNYIGYFEVGNQDPLNQSGTLQRMLIDPSERGKGHGVRAVETIAKFCFEPLEMHRVDLLVAEANRRAIACYLSAGFEIEGRLREARLHNGQRTSMYLMSRLRQD